MIFFKRQFRLNVMSSISIRVSNFIYASEGTVNQLLLAIRWLYFATDFGSILVRDDLCLRPRLSRHVLFTQPCDKDVFAARINHDTVALANIAKFSHQRINGGLQYIYSKLYRLWRLLVWKWLLPVLLVVQTQRKLLPTMLPASKFMADSPPCQNEGRK